MAPVSIPDGKGSFDVATDWTDNRKNLMLFSGRAHPELAEQVAKELDVSVTAQTARLAGAVEGTVRVRQLTIEALGADQRRCRI